MAMNATIATTLSMNSRPFTSGLQTGEKGLTSFGEQIKKLQADSKRFKDQAEQAATMTGAQYKRLAGTMQGVNWNRFVAEMTLAAKTEQAVNSATGQLAVGMRQLAGATDIATASRRRFSQTSNLGVSGRRGAGNGLLELSRGVEDFAIGASLGGVAMGLRGATNNINAYLSRLGAYGAIASLAVTAGTVLIGYFERKTKAINDTNEAMKQGTQLFGEFKSQLDAKFGAQQDKRNFTNSVREMDSVDDASKAIAERRQQIKDLRDEANKLQMEEMKRWDDRFRANDHRSTPQEFAAADAAHAAVQLKQNENLKERKQLEAEILELSRKAAELQKVKIKQDQEEFAGRIAQFQEADREEMRRERERQARDLGSVEGMLKGRIGGLGGAVDPLEGMGIPEELKSRIAGLLGDNKRPAFQLAQVATADSQSLLRVQAQAKDAAERKKEAAKMIKALEDLLREVREAKRGIQNADDGEDVNLN